MKRGGSLTQRTDLSRAVAKGPGTDEDGRVLDRV